MSDLEITRLCAEAMGHHQRKITDGGAGMWVIPHHSDPQCLTSAIKYEPLHDDAQAMALVKKMRLTVEQIHNARTASTKPQQGRGRNERYAEAIRASKRGIDGRLGAA